MTEPQQAFVVHAPTMVHAGQLSAASYNPNKMSPKEYEALKESIREHGFVEPIVVQKIGMRIIGGHHRVRAVKELAIEAGAPIPKIPCTVLDIDDAAAKKLNLKLQHIHGAPDPRLLGELLIDIFEHDEIKFESEAVAKYGIEFEDASKYVRLADPDFDIGQIDSGDKPKEFGRSITLSIEFETVRARDAIKKLLTEQAGVLKKKSGDIVAEALARPKRKSLPPEKKKGRQRSAAA